MHLELVLQTRRQTGFRKVSFGRLIKNDHYSSLAVLLILPLKIYITWLFTSNCPILPGPDSVCHFSGWLSVWLQSKSTVLPLNLKAGQCQSYLYIPIPITVLHSHAACTPNHSQRMSRQRILIVLYEEQDIWSCVVHHGFFQRNISQTLCIPLIKCTVITGDKAGRAAPCSSADRPVNHNHSEMAEQHWISACVFLI